MQAIFRLTSPQIIHFETGLPRRRQPRRSKRRSHRLLLTTLHTVQFPEIRFLIRPLRQVAQERLFRQEQIPNRSLRKIFLYATPNLLNAPNLGANSFC